MKLNILMACPGIIAGILNRRLLLFALLAFIPLIYLISKLPVIINWDLSQGIIIDVTLYNDFDQPCTEAHINFIAKDNTEHKCMITIGHYGDYEEGIEPELDHMLQNDREYYLNKNIPVFCSPKDTDKYIIYLEHVRD